MVPSDAAQPIISSDVFDTLLLRDFRSESRRFSAHATLASRMLFDELGVKLPPDIIASTRSTAQRHAYRALDLAGSAGDTNFDAIIQATADLLNFDNEGARVLKAAELASEIGHLRPNRSLLDWLTRQSEQGKRIIAISDIYYSSETVIALLNTLAPGNPVACIYTSADHNATKRSGALFKVVLEHEGARPSDILHIGDDWQADFFMARSAGLQGVHLRRPLTLRAVRKADAIAQRFRRIAAMQGQSLIPAGRSV
jgi:predicted HAD superfamily hydrolase